VAVAAAVLLLSAFVTVGAAAVLPPPDLRPVLIRQPPGAPAGQPERVLYVPAGFTATAFAKLPTSEARALALGPSGALYVSQPMRGAVDAVLDADGDGFADALQPVLAGRQCPYGLAVSDGSLYVAEGTQVSRFALDPAVGHGLQAPGTGEVLVSGLPRDPCQSHGYRPLAVDPIDGALYVALGSRCNVCLEVEAGDDQRARVWRYSATQTGAGTPFAHGLRNVTDLAINPWTGALWGVSPERDDLGDNEPPEVISELRAGSHYGWPSCYFGSDGRWHPDSLVPTADGECPRLTEPSVSYQAHSVPLGLAFHDGTGLPSSFGPSLFVALHGSWDHSAGVGYKVVRVPLDQYGEPAGPPQEFALGWLPRPSNDAPQAAWGRPVDVAVAPDGVLYVSDDRTGTIYRFAYTPPG
jgi:glucose/arabinose dehydrogenase